MSFPLSDFAPGLRFLAHPCVHKVAHDSEKQAVHAMNRQRERVDATDAALLNVYRCMHCSKWHVGRRPSQNWRKNNAVVACGRPLQKRRY